MGKKSAGTITMILLTMAISWSCHFYEKADEESMDDILKPAVTDVPNFSIVLNIYQGGSGQISYICTDDFKAYMRDGDVIVLVNGNGIPKQIYDPSVVTNPPALHKDVLTATAQYRDANPDELNEFLARLKSFYAGIHINYEIYTNGFDFLDQVLAGLNENSKEQIAGITTGYEPGYLAEFRYSLSESVAYLNGYSDIVRKAGFKSGAAPSGRGLSANLGNFREWNYGRFSQEVDSMIIQTQTHLAADSKNKDLDIPNYKARVIAPLNTQMKEYPGACLIYPQVTIGNDIYESAGANANSSGLVYCIKAAKVIKEANFPGISLWFSNQQASLDNMFTLIKTMRTAQ